MNIFSKIFKTKEQPPRQPLTIEGIPQAPITPEPDDAELAAQAILEMMAEKTAKRKGRNDDRVAAHNNDIASLRDKDEKTAAYYRAMADRIRDVRATAAQRATRFVALCEQKLQEPDLPHEGDGSLALLEVELYKRLDTVEREGGELKRRWQHCLAEVTVRLMEETDNTREVE